MKKYRIFFIVAVSFLLLAGATYAYFANRKIEVKQQENSKQAEDAKIEKGDNPPETKTEPLPTEPSKEVTQVKEELPIFSEASLTVYLNQQETIGPDGKTKIPVGALMPNFYLPSGNFTVQKLSGSNWQDVLTNVSYPGHGGLWAFYTEPTEDNIQYRVLKIENNKPVSVSKIFVVKRADLSGGSKTYN